MTVNSEREVIVVENTGEGDKPWFVSLEGVGALETARAKLNHPARHFATKEEAEDVAEKIRELLKSDEVEVRDDSYSSADDTPISPAGVLVEEEYEVVELRDDGSVTSTEGWESEGGTTRPQSADRSTDRFGDIRT